MIEGRIYWSQGGWMFEATDGKKYLVDDRKSIFLAIGRDENSKAKGVVLMSGQVKVTSLL